MIVPEGPCSNVLQIAKRKLYYYYLKDLNKRTVGQKGGGNVSRTMPNLYCQDVLRYSQEQKSKEEKNGNR